jgi:hypothetical protein
VSHAHLAVKELCNREQRFSLRAPTSHFRSMESN